MIVEVRIPKVLAFNFYMEVEDDATDEQIQAETAERVLEWVEYTWELKER